MEGFTEFISIERENFGELYIIHQLIHQDFPPPPQSVFPHILYLTDNIKKWQSKFHGLEFMSLCNLCDRCFSSTVMNNILNVYRLASFKGKNIDRGHLYNVC